MRGPSIGWRVVSVGLAALAFTGGCGDDGPGSSSGTSSALSSRWGRPPSEAFGGATARPPSTPSTTPSTLPSTSTTTEPGADVTPVTIDDDASADLPGVDGALILTRQRDLLDRGLINVELTNDSVDEVFFVERRLEVDGFVIEPAAARMTRLGPGRRLRVQVPYGHTDDCDSTDALTARLVVGVVDGPDAVESTPATLELGGVDLVEGIRRRQCAAAAVAEAASVEIMSVVDAGDRADIVVVVERIAGDTPLTFSNSTGTILVRTESTLADQPVTLGADEGSTVELDVGFVVNRCDPHALAEVTKRYGLDLHISVGDAGEEPVPVDIEEIVDLLETLVERCVQAADAG